MHEVIKSIKLKLARFVCLKFAFYLVFTLGTKTCTLSVLSPSAKFYSGCSSSCLSNEETPDLYDVTVHADQLPIVYSDEYNITFFGLQKLHPFDSEKWGRIIKFLEGNILKYFHI